MHSKFLIQQCLMTIAVTTASEYRRTRYDMDTFDLEFGRATHREHDIVDSEVRFRDLLEEDLLFFSMSMSMSMSLDYNAPTTSPIERTTRPTTSQTSTSTTGTPAPSASITSLPTGLAFDSDGLTETQCEGDAETLSVALEVETAIGKDNFEDDLENALRTAFEGIYSFCGTSRRLSGRSLMESGVLGDISIVTQNELCSAQSNLADACHVANANFDVYGDRIDTQDIRDSMAIIFSDGDFIDSLLLEGIVAVRAQEISNTEAPIAETSNTEAQNREAAINAPLADGDSTSSGGGEKTKIAAILAAAAGTILVAVMIRKFNQRSSPEGKYDTDSDSQEEDHTMANTTV